MPGACRRIPDTLGHSDFNPGNIIVGPERCTFLDWAEAYVGHPFLTFEYFLAHLRKDYPQLAPLESELRASYSRIWSSVASPEQIAQAYSFSPLVAVYAYAVVKQCLARSRTPEGPRLPRLSAKPDPADETGSRLHAAAEGRMSQLTVSRPCSTPDPVTEIFHGVSVTDPYRWLEDQDSPRTRTWIEEQTRYARSYLDNIPGRERIRERIREFLAVETYDSLQIAGGRYFFRKRLPDQEQPCIYMREGADGEDRLLIDPSERRTGKYTAVKPLRVSPDGRLLLYEVKEGGERTGTFELLEIETRKRLPDLLPRGYLRGFVVRAG